MNTPRRTGRTSTRPLFTSIPLLLLPFALAACGGGGGGGNKAPTADAGGDQAVDEGVVVILDASASTDPEGKDLDYAWQQLGGGAVNLDDPSSPTPSFIAPSIPGGADLVFEVTVTDPGSASASDQVTITVNDITPPDATMTPAGDILGKTEPVVITFSEAMDPDSLVLDGSMGGEATAVWTDDTTLELVPSATDGEWSSGPDRGLSLSASDTAGNAMQLEANWLVKLVFENFQAADIVVGQPNMTSNGWGTDAGSFTGLYGSAHVHDGRLYAPDYSGSRMLGFSSLPIANGTNADFIIGQSTFTGSDMLPGNQTLAGPQSPTVYDGSMVVADYDMSRVAIYTPVPTATENSGPGTISVVVGQRNFDDSLPACTASGLNSPESSLVTPDGKLLVADASNHRVLIWNSLPTVNGQPADLVLGQQAFDTCAPNDSDGDGMIDRASASTLAYPAGIWSDGKKLVVLDRINSRALVWNSFPTSNAQAADLVLGQADFTKERHDDSDGDGFTDRAAANTLDTPYIGVASNGEQLFITDSGNSRVLVWDSWPTANHQPADHVLGQSGFATTFANDDNGDGVTEPTPTARTMGDPNGLFVHEDKLIVTDNYNNRYLIYTSR